MKRISVPRWMLAWFAFGAMVAAVVVPRCSPWARAMAVSIEAAVPSNYLQIIERERAILRAQRGV